MGLSDLFIRVLCIGSVLLYAASASLITKPQIQISPAVIEKVLQITENTTSSFEVVSVADQFLIEKVSARVNSLESLFRIIGAPQQPITLVIDHDHPVRVSIGATDIILGVQAASVEGQLEHSILKAWLRQVGSSEVLNNPLRVEVYADLLSALFRGELRLQDPENKEFAVFSNLENWTDDLLGTGQLCSSAWRPAELISYCSGAKNQNNTSQTSYSLRKVVGSLIWNDLGKLNLTAKRDALKSLSRNIRSQSLVAHIESAKTTGDELVRLQSSIEAEAREIYPSLVSSLPATFPNVGLLKDNQLSLAGGFEIAMAAPKFKKMIVESCTSPTLKQLLAKTTEETEHILLVENCENKRVNYAGFVKAGPARFARENLTVKFVYLHRASLKLAAKMIDGFDIQAALEFDSSPSSIDLKNAKFLGLDQKIFREDLGAFKVNGPIGAIEWYRPKTPTESESHS